jgi:hypothetical protein
MEVAGPMRGTMIERLLLKAGVGAQWYRHASTACLALGGGIFLLVYERWWGFAVLLFGGLEGAIAVTQVRARVVVTAPAPKTCVVLFRGDAAGAALFGTLIGATAVLAAWWDNPASAVVLGLMAAVAAVRFAYRRGVEGYMAVIFLIAFAFAIFLTLH